MKFGTITAKSLATTQRLIDCAVDEIAMVGPDSVAFTAVAKRAGMTTGALYARFESREELLVSVWIERAQPVFERLGDLAAAMMLGDAQRMDAARRDCTALLAEHRDTVKATMQLLMVARRLPALHEVVLEVSRAQLDRAARETKTRHAETRFLMCLVGALNALVIEFALDGHPAYFGAGLQRLADQVNTAATARSRKSPEVTLPNFADIIGDVTGDEDLGRSLLLAVSTVVASAGCVHATTARIGRRAGLNPAMIYAEFPDKEALLLAAIEKGLTGFYSTYRIAFGETVPPDHWTSRWIADLQPDAADGRRFRLESVLSATTDPLVRGVVSSVFRRSIDDELDRLGLRKETQRAKVAPLIVSARMFDVTRSLLAELYPDILTLDWGPVTRAVSAMTTPFVAELAR